MHRSIVGFHQDSEQHWVAELDCGHCQHTRHEPPFFPRPWVITEEGRKQQIGQLTAFFAIAKRFPMAILLIAALLYLPTILSPTACDRAILLRAGYGV